MAYSTRQTQLKSLIEQATASRRAAELAEIRYREGAADFLVLLDAQRTQLDAEDAVAQAQTAGQRIGGRDLQGAWRSRAAYR